MSFGAHYLDPDPDGLLEYSVVFTDRSLNHMSKKFQKVMNDISCTLKSVYQAEAVVVVPGGGSYGMETVARQFATDKKVLVIRNGLFSYRWTQIFEAGKIPSSSIVLKARRLENSPTAPFVPCPIDDVVHTIMKEQPDVVFAPHVETSAGMMLPKEYIQAMAAAVHTYGGLLVLDCVASGSMWIHMRDIGVDVLISAPQKGWSSPPSSALIMLSASAIAQLEHTTSTSFALDLKKWHAIMQTYEQGSFAYHATMPTDALYRFSESIQEMREFGFDLLMARQEELGLKTRALLGSRGFCSVAADGFQAPGVVVVYTSDPTLKSGQRFASVGVQIAAGVPLFCDEGADFATFRLGLFGLDKLYDVDKTVQIFADKLTELGH